MCSPYSFIKKAVEIAGGQTALAIEISATPGNVQTWLKSGKVPYRFVLDVERATGGAVTRFDLCPDLNILYDELTQREVDEGVKAAFKERSNTNIDLVGRVINEAGGGPILAKAVGLKSASIYKWRRSRGIPYKYAIAIEKATNGAVSRFEICTELVEILTAPPVVPQGDERPKQARGWRYEAGLAA